MDFNVTTTITEEKIHLSNRYAELYLRKKNQQLSVILFVIPYLYCSISVLVKHSPRIHLLFFLILILFLDIVSYIISTALTKHTLRKKAVPSSHLFSYFFHITDEGITIDFGGENQVSASWQLIQPQLFSTNDYFVLGNKFIFAKIFIFKDSLTSEQLDFIQSKVLPKKVLKYKLKK